MKTIGDEVWKIRNDDLGWRNVWIVEREKAKWIKYQTNSKREAERIAERLNLEEGLRVKIKGKK